MRALVALDVTYAQGYGLARPGPPWPSPLPEATAAGAAEIRAGLRVATTPRGVAGAFAGGLAELSDDLAAATTIADLGAADRRAAGMLRADDVALMRVDREPTSSSCSPATTPTRPARAGRSRDFPATRYVLDHRVPGQVVVGDEAGDPAELAELAELGMASVLIVPVVYGGRDARRPRGLPHPAAGLHRPRGRPRPRARPAVRRGPRPPHLKGSPLVREPLQPVRAARV